MSILSDKIAAQRETNAAVCRENADYHGHHTQWGKEALREAAAWDAAASRARAGDTTPFRPCPHCRGDHA